MFQVRSLLLLFLTATGLMVIAQTPLAGQQVRPIDESLRKRLGLDPFYQKQVDLHGFPILGSSKVSDAALLEARWIIDKMIGHRKDILTAMTENRTRLAVMAHNEYTTDVPEHRGLKPRIYWDRRARGLGATPAAPAVSCAEENLLGFRNDPYSSENILIHEFAHAIHSMGLKSVDSDFDKRLDQAFRQAQAAGLWKDTYANVNRMEYWAEAVQSWFDNNREDDELHNSVNTRAELRAYDPRVAKLCEEVFGNGKWKYTKPENRPAESRRHLVDFDSAQSPVFQWRKESIPANPRVLVQTTVGDFEVTLDAKRAPVTVKNFLDYVHSGFYSGGSFFRTVRADNQPKSKIKIAVVQASAGSKYRDRFRPPIKLERTRDTGLSHVAGAISMGRSQPDSATHHFFICVGDQPELDFEGKRNPDGQGFAAFGKVTKGMEVIKKIHQANSTGQNLSPAIKIQRVIRLK